MDLHSGCCRTAYKFFQPAKCRVALKPSTPQNLHRERSRTQIMTTRQPPRPTGSHQPAPSLKTVGQGRRSCCASPKTTPNRRFAKRNGQHIIKPKATLAQLKVADALQAEPAMPLPRKLSKIEVPCDRYFLHRDDLSHSRRHQFKMKLIKPRTETATDLRF